MYDNIQANILPLHTYLTTEWGQKVKTIFFSENGHVAYQIKGNDTYNIIQVII